MNSIPTDYRAPKKYDKAILQKDRPPKLINQLLMVALTMLVLMTAYEWLKQIIFPNITIWRSHLLTILFTSIIATITSFLIFKKLSIAYKKILDETAFRKTAENALKQSHDTLNTVLSASPIAIGFIENGLVKWVNKEMLTMFKFESEEFYKGKDIKHFISSEDEYHRLSKKVYERLKKGKPASNDVTFKCMDDSTFFGHFKMNCQVPSNPVEKIVFTISDISWRKQAEEEREKLITDLQKALAEIKTLRDILPLCSFCKKIRDDQGYWEQVDVYIHKYLQADISHSICPDCMKKHYPKEYEEIQ